MDTSGDRNAMASARRTMGSLVLLRPEPTTAAARVARLLEPTPRANMAQALRLLVDDACAFGWQGDIWACALAEALVLSENPLSLALERKSAPCLAAQDSLIELAKRDLALYRSLFLLKLPEPVACARAFCHEAPEAPRREAGERIQALAQALSECYGAMGKGDAGPALELLSEFYQTYGVGLLGLGELFRVGEAKGRVELCAVEGRRRVQLDDLVGYEEQKALLCRNTEAFLAGRGANNVLLYGDAGTGKSTSVQALAGQYAREGLRVVELTKRQFGLIPSLLDTLKRRNYRFVLLLDDLSFEENEVAYKELKAVMEGGGEPAPKNVLIYATSNRRHLVKETWADRSDLQHSGDIHRSDTMEEKLSLAGRFGLQIYYPNPSFEEYHTIVRTLARRTSALDELSDAALSEAAAAWQVRRGNRSGRTAQQFIATLLAQ